MQRFLTILLVLLLCGAAWLSFDAWWTPLDVREQLAATAATDGPFAAAEAAGFAEALWGTLRLAAPLAFVVASIAFLQRRRLAPFLTSAGRGLLQATTTDQSAGGARLTWLVRGFVAVWAAIAVTQFGESVVQRMRDWYAYRLYAGETSLPNISETNRQVIRYVKSATPEDARILVLSDQKLSFLSYYLLPRRLYHPLHPDSEFVIPLAHGQRQLAAYTRDDLDPQYLAQLKPDYVLEYFEGETYVDSARVPEDSDWLRFLGHGQIPGERPQILVVLRPYPPEGTP